MSSLQIFESVDHPPAACPRCRIELNAAARVHGEPRAVGPGAMTVCIRCSAVLVFQEDMTLALARADELAQLDPAAAAALARAVALVQDFGAKTKRWRRMLRRRVH